MPRPSEGSVIHVDSAPGTQPPWDEPAAPLISATSAQVRHVHKIHTSSRHPTTIIEQEESLKRHGMSVHHTQAGLVTHGRFLHALHPLCFSNTLYVCRSEGTEQQGRQPAGTPAQARTRSATDLLQTQMRSILCVVVGL